MAFRFEVVHRSARSRARVGRIYTRHGVIDTPGFVPVATNAVMKHLTSKQLHEIGTQLIFCNTYHLAVHPGTKVVEEAGGLHAFMKYRNPIITDSGGFQVFSLLYGSVAEELKSKGKKRTGEGGVLKISEDGVLFRNYRDGSKMLFTPETSIDHQKALGADLIIPFDELPPYHCDPAKLVESLERTHRWELRSLARHLANPNGQVIYAVVHGGTSDALREKSAKTLQMHPFDGFALGGSFGRTDSDLVDVVKFTMPLLPPERPVHLLGIAHESGIEACVPHGVDTFDSCYPARVARHGTLLTKSGRKIYLSKTVHARHFGPPEDGCTCATCSEYSLAYLHHLFKASEPTANVLSTVHNIHVMLSKMAAIRERILRDEV